MGKDVTKPVAVETAASATRPAGSVNARQGGPDPPAQRVSSPAETMGSAMIQVKKRSQSGVIFASLPECPAGFYGAGCQQRCLCQNGATCNKTNGKCACVKGWTGTACELGKTQRIKN